MHPEKLNGYKEEDYLMLSGIQHFSFCRRQWALIHIEQQWEENLRTVEGIFFTKRPMTAIPRRNAGTLLYPEGCPYFQGNWA